MSTDIKLNKSQFFKIIQSVGFIGAVLDKLAGPLVKLTVLSARNVLRRLATVASAFAIDRAIQSKMYGKGVIRAGKGICLPISN